MFCCFAILKFNLISHTQKNSFILSPANDLLISQDYYPSFETFDFKEKQETDKTNEQEALNSIAQATEFKNKKKFEKAVKLFKVRCL